MVAALQGSGALAPCTAACSTCAGEIGITFAWGNVACRRWNMILSHKNKSESADVFALRQRTREDVLCPTACLSPSCCGCGGASPCCSRAASIQPPCLRKISCDWSFSRQQRSTSECPAIAAMYSIIQGVVSCMTYVTCYLQPLLQFLWPGGSVCLPSRGWNIRMTYNRV